MKKSISLLLLLTMPLLGHANDGDHERIDVALNQIAALTEQVLGLQKQVNGLPKPIYYSPGDGIIIQNNVISSTSLHQVGEHYQGGIVFYVDAKGQHGLIVSKTDLNNETGIAWRNSESGNRITNARANGIGAGEGNTRLIIAQQTLDYPPGLFAALVAANHQVVKDGVTPCTEAQNPLLLCYGNWYLPSNFELQLLYQNAKRAKVSLAPDVYWSSTEINVSSAYLFNFATGESTPSLKSNTLGRVRAISRF